MSRVPEADVVFNVVWTKTVFDHLHPFVTSQLEQSEARFRFVANGCPPEQIAAMERYAQRWGGRVVEVLDVSPEEMVAHGIALDRVRACRDDGPLFALIDPDIKANAPFVTDLLIHLEGAVGVTSGTELWTSDNVVPEGAVGVGGRHFFTPSGFVVGSPHLAVYRRDALEATSARWDVGIGSAGPEVSEEGKQALRDVGLEYLVYDTGKLVNAFLQVDGGRVVHHDLDQLVHIGGMSDFLGPRATKLDEDGNVVPHWQGEQPVETRYAVASYAAAVLAALDAGEPPPPLPEATSLDVHERLAVARRELSDRVAGQRPGSPDAEHGRVG